MCGPLFGTGAAVPNGPVRLFGTVLFRTVRVPRLVRNGPPRGPVLFRTARVPLLVRDVRTCTYVRTHVRARARTGKAVSSMLG